MKELTIGKLKAGFSRVIEAVQNGEKITVLKGRNLQKVAMIVPYPKGVKPVTRISGKRVLGRDKGAIKIMPDFDELPEDITRSFGIE